MHNLLFAFRYLLKPRGGNLARLLSLTLALAVSIVVFSYANYVLTFDRFYPDVERIYQLWDFNDEGNISPSMIAPLGPALQEEIPVVEAATRLRGNFETDLCRDNHTYEAWVMAVDSMFFRVLDFGLIKGDMTTFTGHDKLMLSESLARTIFGDSDPIGQIVLYENATPRTVVGIFRDPPSNTHLGNFNALIPFDALAGSFYMGWDGGDSFPTYLKLRAGHTPSDVEALLPAFFERHGLTKSIEQFGSHYLLQPITRSAQTGTTLVQTTRILLALALLILFVGVMNYVLLSISSLASRAKTFAMLRCNGARRGDVLAIFLSETLILTAAALLVAVFVIWALQQQITMLTDTPLGELFAPARIWVPLTVVLVTFLAAGLLPAQLFAATPLTLVFRSISADHRWWKRLLLVVELLCVTFAFILLTGFSLQLHRLRYGDFGFDASRVVSMSPVGTRAQWRNMEEAFTALPEVEAAGATSHLPVWGYSGQPCYDETTREMLFGCRFSVIDENYLATMGMHLVAGDNFTLQSSLRDVLVNETYCRVMTTLDRMGVLEVRRGDGTYVKSHRTLAEDPLGLSRLDDKYKLALELFDVRLALEPEIAAAAAEHAAAEDKARLEALCDEVERIYRAGGDHIPKDIAFHTCIARCSQNRVMEMLVPIINTAVMTFANLTGHALMEETIYTHRAVTDAILDGDSVGARCAMVMHLTYNRQAILKLWKNRSEASSAGETSDLSEADREARPCENCASCQGD